MLGYRTREDLSKLQIHSYNLSHEINYMNVSMIYCLRQIGLDNMFKLRLYIFKYIYKGLMYHIKM